MAQSSQAILEQIQKNYGNPSDASNIIESTIRDAYAPSVKNLIQEGNTLRGEYYPSFFNEAQKLGTTAADMSPAARLAAMQNAGESAGQLYRTNLGLRDYYKTDINSMIDRAMNAYNTGYGTLKDMYSMALQGEQARNQNDYYNTLKNLALGQGQTGTTAEGMDFSTVPNDLNWDQNYMNELIAAGAKKGGVVTRNDGTKGIFVILPDGRYIRMWQPQTATNPFATGKPLDLSITNTTATPLGNLQTTNPLLNSGVFNNLNNAVGMPGTNNLLSVGKTF